MFDHNDIKISNILFGPLLCLAIMFSNSVAAETLVIDHWIGSDLIDRPARGDSMQKVEQQFGQALEEYGPVGNPPITRWVYDDFTVVFEGQWVISSPVPHKKEMAAEEVPE